MASVSAEVLTKKPHSPQVPKKLPNLWTQRGEPPIPPHAERRGLCGGPHDEAPCNPAQPSVRRGSLPLQRRDAQPHPGQAWLPPDDRRRGRRDDVLRVGTER